MTSAPGEPCGALVVLVGSGGSCRALVSPSGSWEVLRSSDGSGWALRNPNGSWQVLVDPAELGSP